MVGISPDRDGNSFRALPVTAHPVKATHFGGSLTQFFVILFLPDEQNLNNLFDTMRTSLTATSNRVTRFMPRSYHGLRY